MFGRRCVKMEGSNGPAKSRGQVFEEEKRRIIDSCFGTFILGLQAVVAVTLGIGSTSTSTEDN